MAIYYKILGQVNPSINTNTTVYQVPSGANAVVSTINICNQVTTSSTFSIATITSNAAVGAKNYIAYNVSVPSSDAIALTLGVTLAANDAIMVSTNNANVSFSVFGSEIYA